MYMCRGPSLWSLSQHHGRGHVYAYIYAQRSPARAPISTKGVATCMHVYIMSRGPLLESLSQYQGRGHMYACICIYMYVTASRAWSQACTRFFLPVPVPVLRLLPTSYVEACAKFFLPVLEKAHDQP